MMEMKRIMSKENVVAEINKSGVREIHIGKTAQRT